MITKSESLEFLKFKIAKVLSGEIHIHPVNDWLDVSVINQAIIESTSCEDAYIRLGETLSESDSYFKDIRFREDCYDYLIQKGFKEKEAYNLMEIIRKGKYRFEKYQISSDRLSKEFYDWAKGVKYLPSRKVLKDMLKNNTIYKTAIVNEFSKYYYKKLKKSLPDKIVNGEVEWIYSYGDKLIASGNKSVFNVVKQIVETKNCENSYIETEILYLKCQELYKKYKHKIFWFSWFK